MVAAATPDHGVIDRHRLRELGVPSSTISGWVGERRLHRVHRGVFAIAPPALLCNEARWLAAVRACGETAVLWGRSAAELLWLLKRRRRTGTPHVAVRDRARISPGGVIVHRPRHLEARDVTRRSGIPVTTPTRTVFDLASVLRPGDLRELFEQAEYLEELDRPRLAALLRGASGRSGLGELRRLLGYEPLPLSQVRSRLERIVLSTCRTHSLPLPQVNVPLLGYEVDFYWPAAELVVEADGGQHVRERRAKDNSRDLEFQLTGRIIRRYNEEALADEDAVAADLLEILRIRLSGPASSAGSASR